MNKLTLLLTTLAMALSLTACPDKNDNGPAPKKVASTPPSTTNNCQWNAYSYQWLGPNQQPCTPPNPNANNNCMNYIYNYPQQNWVNQTGQPVQCNSAYYSFNNGNVLPYYWMNTNMVMMNGCTGWQGIYGAPYVPANLGYGFVCVRADLMTPYYGVGVVGGTYPYTGVPTTCVTGYNCASTCGGGANLTASWGPLWVGGTLSMCF